MTFLDTDYAWAAGFLDGEGCFTLLKHGSSSTHYSQRALHISASQADIQPLIKLREMFGGRVGRRSRDTLKGTPIYVWTLGMSSKTVAEFVPQVLPYLIVKHRQAEILLEFSTTIRRRGRPKSGIVSLTTQDEIDTRMRLIEEIEVIRGRSAAEEVMLG